MNDVEEGALLKLNGASSTVMNFCDSSALLAQQRDTFSSSLLWHACFGHINYENIIIVRQKGIKGFPTIPKELTPCDACILGKHSRKPFHSSSSRDSRKLGIIHSDLCGPMLVGTANGNKCMLTFIDDYSRMCWVYLLKDKSQVFENFKTFHSMVKNESHLNIGILRIDNGGEYTSNDFEQYLKDNRIKHQTIIPYNP